MGGHLLLILFIVFLYYYLFKEKIDKWRDHSRFFLIESTRQVKKSRDLAREARSRRHKHADVVSVSPNELKDSSSSERKDYFQPDYDKVAISCLIALSFGAALAFALYETLGTVLLQVARYHDKMAVEQKNKHV